MDSSNEKDPLEEVNGSELGHKEITPLFARYTMLTFAGLAAQAVMVVIEGLVIGRGLGSNGLATVGIIMPLEYLMLALGGFFAIGTSTLCAMRLGEGKEKEARRIFGQGSWYSIIVGLTVAILIAVFASQVATLLGATPQLHSEVTTFIRIFMIGYPFCMIGHVTVYMVRVDERPDIATWAMSSSAIIAALWLYLSVFPLHIGFVGAAFYYAFSIGIWGFFFVYFIFSRKSKFQIHWSDLKMDKKIILAISKIGFPFMLIQASSTVFTMVLNNFLGKYGTQMDIAAFSVINSYIIYILMLITQATSGGQQPIASYNYGANLFGRVIKLIKVSLIANIVGIYILAGLCFVFSNQIVAFFVGSGSSLVGMAGGYSKIVVSCAALGLTANLMSGYFQAVERILESTILGVCRYLIFGIPAIFIMAHWLGVTGVWFSQPVSDVLAFLLTMWLTVREIGRLKKFEKKSN
ncbi:MULTISPECIES: MATE family efflux transporter [Levilactobacillus]|uniref:MATE family efflux transporter n=1 Tax=Levilactobacillus TaxID=2767886 RepID=UPI003756795B